MKNVFRTLSLVLLCAVPMAACDNEGPAQKAGISVDKAAQEVKDMIAPPGPMEKAGRSVDNALK